jgi:hypothetical protein
LSGIQLGGIHLGTFYCGCRLWRRCRKSCRRLRRLFPQDRNGCGRHRARIDIDSRTWSRWSVLCLATGTIGTIGRLLDVGDAVAISIKLRGLNYIGALWFAEK